VSATSRGRDSDHEHCERCLLAAPRWSAPGYASWELVLAPCGELLAVLCPRCAADAELSLELLAAPRA